MARNPSSRDEVAQLSQGMGSVSSAFRSFSIAEEKRFWDLVHNQDRTHEQALATIIKERRK